MQDNIVVAVVAGGIALLHSLLFFLIKSQEERLRLVQKELAKKASHVEVHELRDLLMRILAIIQRRPRRSTDPDDFEPPGP